MLKTDIFKVVESQNLKSLRGTLKKKPDIIHKCKNGETLLHRAAQMENSDVMEVLLLHGVNVNKRENTGRTALHISCSLGHYKGVLVLREHDADPSITCVGGETALHEAAKNGNIRIIKYLFNYDFDINTQNKQGWTPLHRAVNSNRIDAVTVLLQEGVDISIETNKGKTAYSMAIELQRFEMAQEIEKYERKTVIPLTKTETDTSSPKINFGGIFSDGKKNIGSFFKWAPQHPKTNETHPDNEPEEKSAPSTNTDMNCNIPETHDVSNSNFFQVTSEKMKNLLWKPPLDAPDDVTNGENIANTINVEEIENHSEVKEEEDKEENENAPLDTGEEQSDEEESATINTLAKIKTKSKISKFKNLGKAFQSKKLFTRSDKKQKHSRTINLDEDGDETDEDDEKRKEEEAHECPVCFEIPLPPTHIYQCVNGHLYCGKCAAQPNMFNCPQCGVEIASLRSRNRYAEENIERLYGKKK